jgi:hypothetical protein
MRGIGFDLAPDLPDVDAYVIDFSSILRSPNDFEQYVVRHHNICVTREDNAETQIPFW